MRHAVVGLLWRIFIELLSWIDESDRSTEMKGGYIPETHNLSNYIVWVGLTSQMLYDRNHLCTGTIIDPSYVLTAATCVIMKENAAYPFNPDLRTHGKLKKPDRYIIIAASALHYAFGKTSRIMQVKRIIYHKDFNEHLLTIVGKHHNLAILQLTYPLVGLQGLPMAKVKPKVGAECTTLGWGQIKPKGPIAMEATYFDQKIISQRECRKSFTSTFNKLFNVPSTKIKPSLLCATDANSSGDIGICQGDIGAPLICDGLLVGVASYRMHECQSKVNGVYSSVSYYNKWINEQLVTKK